MSQQLQITGGAKVRDLQDVIIGTSGVLSSLAFNVANGVPKLDVNGKILVSQLPNSVMEYKGTWDASTNTPTLVNGTGNQGDVYLCNVAGTTNFGAGPITFAVGDSAIYSGTIWQRAGGATGTVTSVGLSSTGNDAITITGSPITTSGNINLGFAGTNLQYINGAGDLTTFPTLISSIGLSMPTAFNVSNSPLTANGTIAVTGAGFPSQYIRGDGTLADFPTSGGGGSSVSYYLNGGTSQGVIGGITYYEMSKIAVIGTGVDFPKSGDGLIVSFLTDAGDPAQLNIPAGNWNYEIYASMSANGGTPQLYAELYVYDGTTFTLIATSTNEILYDGTTLNLYTFAMAVPATTLALTDRLAVKLYATNSGGKTTTVHTQDGHLCQIITTFSTGITALNGLTAQVQYFATGTSGTDFNISSATATHTFNLPVASAANTGKLSSTDWSTFNGKVPYTGATTNVNLGGFGITASSLNVTNTSTLDGNILLKKAGIAVTTSTYVSQFAASSGVGIGYSDGTGGANFTFPTASISTYTFPAATGTLALTSNLSAYVPYTGATGSVDLGVYDIKTAGTQLKDGQSFTPTLGYTSLSSVSSGVLGILGLTFDNNAGGATLQFTRNVFNTYTFPAASGTLALTSNLGSYLPLTGGTLTGALSGTSGTFSGNIIAGGSTDDTSGGLYSNISLNGTTYSRYSLLTGGTSRARFQFDGTNTSITTTSTGGKLQLATAAATSMEFITNDSLKLTIASNGLVSINETYSSANYKFAVKGASHLAGSNNKGLFITDNATYTSIVGLNKEISSYNPIELRASGTDYQLYLTTAGNVSIGHVGAGGQRLRVQGEDSGSVNYSLVVANSTTASTFLVRNDGAVQVVGSLSKGSGSFRIDHPLKSMTETHQLVHSFIEGPRVDLIYRGKLTLVNGKAQANIDEVATMTEGTFEVLCREVQCFTTNESGWDLIKGKVIGNIIYVESQNSKSTDEISWLVIGERKDKHILETDWTDENGKVIVEPLKPIKEEIEEEIIEEEIIENIKE